MSVSNEKSRQKTISRLVKWFQSKQQEKIEKVNKLKYEKERDDFEVGYDAAISDVLEILKDESKRVN